MLDTRDSNKVIFGIYTDTNWISGVVDLYTIGVPVDYDREVTFAPVDTATNIVNGKDFTLEKTIVKAGTTTATLRYWVRMPENKEDEEGKLVENSFESSDKVNKIYWDRKVKYKDLFEYYKGLISLRKEYKAFRMNTNEEIKENIHFLKKGVNFSENNLVAYIIDAKNIDIKCEKIAVIINANNKDVDVELEESNWHVMVDEKTAGNEIIETIKDSKVNVSRKSIKVLIK